MKYLVILLLGFVLVSPAMLLAQEMTPRAYWPAPKGTRLAQIGYAHTTGDTIPDPSLPITGVDSDIDSYYFAYLQTLSLWGRTANFIMEVPYADGNTSAERDLLSDLERGYQGLGDIDFTLSVNFKGAPTMTREEFAKLRRDPHPILGGSIKVKLPTGQYNSNRAINVGANRWAVKPQLGYILPLHSKWLLEASVGAWFFGDNDDLLGLKREQDPIFAGEAHVVRRFSAGFWGSLDMNYYHGGRSTLGGRKLDDLKRDSKVGATVVYPFALGQSLKFGYSRGSINDSDEEFDYFLVSYIRIF